MIRRPPRATRPDTLFPYPTLFRSGRSMTPLLAGPTPRDWRKDVYYHYYEFPGFHSVRAHYGVRGERYKLVRFYGDGLDAWEFYYLKRDRKSTRLNSSH